MKTIKSGIFTYLHEFRITKHNKDYQWHMSAQDKILASRVAFSHIYTNSIITFVTKHLLFVDNYLDIQIKENKTLKFMLQKKKKINAIIFNI